MWMCLIVSPANVCSYQTVEWIWLCTSFSNAHYDKASTLQLSCVWMNFLHFWIQHRTESFPLDSDKGAVWTHASTHTLSLNCAGSDVFFGGGGSFHSGEPGNKQAPIWKQWNLLRPSCDCWKVTRCWATLLWCTDNKTVCVIVIFP